MTPPDDGPLKKNGTDYNFGSRDYKCGSIFIFDGILGSGEQKSIYRSICLHFKTIFHTNLFFKNAKINKIPPMCRKFLFKLDG